MARTEVFVSFDFDNDKALKDFIIGEGKLPCSPFQVSNHSLKEAAPEQKWETKARTAISRADIFVVMLGPETRRAVGVKKEIAIAKGLGKNRVQIIGYKGGSRDWAVPDSGFTYSWKWDNLKKLLR